MAIKNIQTLQSNHNIFEQDAKEQYIQALANAGQRIGVKGDSITLDQFNFLDILKENPNFSLSEDKENYLGKMVYSLDSNGVPQCNFSVLSKDNFVSAKFDNVINKYTVNYKDIFNVCNTDTLSFDIQLNNYAFVKENSMFKLDKNYFTNILFAKIIGSDDFSISDDVAKFNLEMHYDQYNTETNKLTSAIRIFHLNDYVNPEFAMLRYKLVENNIYELEAWHLVISKKNPLDIQTFENYLCNDKDENRSKYDIFSLIDSLDISDVDSILSSDSKVDTIFSYFLKNGVKINPNNHIYIQFDNIYSNGYSFVVFNEETKKYESVDESTEYIDSLFSSYDQLIDKFGITIKDRIYYMSNDITLLYPRLLEIYCNDVFFNSVSTLAKQIFCRLYENILLEYSNNVDIGENVGMSSVYNSLADNSYNITMYVPLSYDLKYYCNSQNHNQIYNSNNIYVSFVNNISGMISSKLEKLVESSQNIIIDYNDVDKTSVYQFAFNYNDELYNSSLLVKSISIDKLYTLPYIDKSSACWVINDNVTNFKTISDSVTPQTILITYNTYKNNKCNYSIINGLSSDVAESFNTSNNTNEIIRWLERTCIFATNILVGLTNDDIKSSIENFNVTDTNNIIKSINAKCLVPHIRIDSNMVSTFENTILFTIFDTSTFLDSVPEKFKDAIKQTNIYNNYIFTAIWKLDKDNIITDENGISYYAFDYVRELQDDLDSDYKSNYAFDASIFFNNNIAAVRQSLSNLNLFDSIVFYNGEVISQYKDNYTTNKHLLTLFNPSSQYYQNSLETINDDIIAKDAFTNNYILSVKTSLVDYNSIYTRLFDSSNKQVEISSNKFLNLDSKSWSVFNQFYKRTIKANKVKQVLITYSGGANSTILYSKNSSTINSAYYEIIPMSNTRSWVQQNTLDSTNKNIEYYDDKVFSSNVPMLDLKEILLFNTTSLNRFNIIYPDNNVIYNAFLGLPINDSLNKIYAFDRESNSAIVEKNKIVELSASETNINIGNENMLDNADKNKFNKPSTVHVKFDNVVIESDNLFHKTQKYTDILCAGGLNQIGLSTYVENVLIKSSSLLDYNDKLDDEKAKYTIKNYNNLPTPFVYPDKKVSDYSVVLHSTIENANKIKFGLDDNVNNPSNLILFTKEFTPVSTVFDYSRLPNSETRPFANAFNILWLGDKSKYRKVSNLVVEQRENIMTNSHFYQYMAKRFNDSNPLSYTELPIKYIANDLSYSYSYDFDYIDSYSYFVCNTFKDFYYHTDCHTQMSFDDVYQKYLKDLKVQAYNIDYSYVSLDWLRSSGNIKPEESRNLTARPNEFKFRYNVVDGLSKFIIDQYKNTVTEVKCGLEAFSKYSVDNEIIPMIFSKNYPNTNFAQSITIDSVLQDLDYVSFETNSANQVSVKLFDNNDLSMNSFFISKISPDSVKLRDTYVKCFKDNSDEINAINTVLSNYSFDNSKRVYIFRLSDYLLKQYGLDITNEEEFVIDEEFSVQNKIFRIAMTRNIVDGDQSGTIVNVNKPRYAYFLIYDEDDVTIRKFRYSTNDVYINNTLNMVDELTKDKDNLTNTNYNINYYEVAYPKRPIKFIKRKIVKYKPETDYEIASSSANSKLIFNTDYVYNILF